MRYFIFFDISLVELFDESISRMESAGRVVGKAVGVL